MKIDAIDLMSRLVEILMAKTVKPDLHVISSLKSLVSLADASFLLMPSYICSNL